MYFLEKKHIANICSIIGGNKMVKDHKGKEYKNYMQMAKAWGISYEVFHQRFSVLKWPFMKRWKLAKKMAR